MKTGGGYLRLFYDVVICFFLFGFCGWVCECVFCSFNEKKIINRGFVNGPICPIYGFGGLVVVYLLAPLRDNILLLFLGGTLATTALEYMTSVVMEVLFDTRWWDYSSQKWNIRGRVCLKFSLMFGALSVAAVKLLYPPFEALLLWLPTGGKPWIAWGCILMFAADCAVTTYSILSLNGKLAELKRASTELRQRLEAFQGEALSIQEHLERFRADRSEKSAELRKGLEELAARWEAGKESVTQKFQHRRIMDAFPGMRSTKYQEQLADVKAAFVEFKNKKIKIGESEKKS